MLEQFRGRVKFYNRTRGFGFAERLGLADILLTERVVHAFGRLPEAGGIIAGECIKTTTGLQCTQINYLDNTQQLAPIGPAALPAQGGPWQAGEWKWFNRDNGFGFVLVNNNSNAFIHHATIRRSGYVFGESIDLAAPIDVRCLHGRKGLFVTEIRIAGGKK